MKTQAEEILWFRDACAHVNENASLNEVIWFGLLFHILDESFSCWPGSILLKLLWSLPLPLSSPLDSGVVLSII